MNYMNFKNSVPRERGKEIENKQEAFTDEMPEIGKCFCSDHDDVLTALENEFEVFTEIAEILARQECRKRKFYGYLKNAALAFFPILIFSGIIIFAKTVNRAKPNNQKNKKQWEDCRGKSET